MENEKKRSTVLHVPIGCVSVGVAYNYRRGHVSYVTCGCGHVS